jgi:ferric-dicitrate binding protein FerR (iron transport regulator)
MKEIIIKYLEDSATKDEKVALQNWLRNKKNRIDFNLIKAEWTKNLVNDYPEGSEKTWNIVLTGLSERGFTRWQKSTIINRYLRYAAIFFFLTTLGSLSWFIANQSFKGEAVYSKIIAENGQISKAVLPDGSVVWLNSGTSLIYDNGFGIRNRDITLSGEAFFDISKNENLPLIVDCNHFQVKVTGTKFNINAFPGKIKNSIALESGEVTVTNLYSNASYKLTPGQVAEFDATIKTLTLNQANISRYTSWKEGVINFYDQSLEEVLDILKVRYNQEFEVTEQVKRYRYTFTVRNDSLNEIIKLLENITPIKANQHGKIIRFDVDQEKIKRVSK